ncbi:MAG: amidohydrolase family protein [Proteobacteria bacterium]|nr:amidohydrolase family protein [Pseudomonadota bacterium]
MKLSAVVFSLISTILCGMMGMRSASAQDVIDVHSHILTPAYIQAVATHDASLEEGFPLPAWDLESHLKWMDEAGIRQSILTLAAPHPYFGDAAESASIIRKENEAAAKIRGQYPERFKFCAALPLPDVEKAIQEAEYALDVLKADCIKLATNSRGQYLGAAELDPLMAVLDKRNAVIILHPHKPEPYNDAVMQQTPLAMQEYLAETTRAVANMITRDVLARYGNVKIVVPHCGAYLPLALPRMKAIHPVVQNAGMVEDIRWEENLSRLYYDLAGAASVQAIKMMLSITTPDHILYGSDYPYGKPGVLSANLQKLKADIQRDGELAPYLDDFLYKNARKLLFGQADADRMIIRLAEIEVYPKYLSAYLEAAQRISTASVRKEPGVISLIPMQLKENPNKIRILEIYADQAAYQHHISTEHFKTYKQGTLHMVKDLKLIDTRALNPSVLPEILKK